MMVLALPRREELKNPGVHSGSSFGAKNRRLVTMNVIFSKTFDGVYDLLIYKFMCLDFLCLSFFFYAFKIFMIGSAQ